jgi:uridine kinase
MSGLDAVIMFDCSKDTCMVRAIGRRFDPEIDKMYHILN